MWTFYAARPSTPLRAGRYETHADFGPSRLGRNLYPPPLRGREKKWDTYQGRRIDFLARELPVRLHADTDEIIAALRIWLEAGAAQPCRTGTSRNSSAHHLAHKAMVWIGTPSTRGSVGNCVWDVAAEANRFPHLVDNPHRS
mgnify:CR=1 FL=1